MSDSNINLKVIKYNPKKPNYINRDSYQSNRIDDVTMVKK